jgi:uncharacterized membrane protein YdjX (TVP38/TMEM64 family)
MAPVPNTFLKYLMILGLAGTGAAAACLFFTFSLCSSTDGDAGCLWSHFPSFSLAPAIQFIRSSGNLGILVSIGLMIIHSFVPFPAELVAIANGMIYGFFWGMMITWGGAMLGAFLAFGLARKYGRPFVVKCLGGEKAQKLDDWTARHGAGTLFVCRFIPVISFNLINYAAGLLRIPWSTFALTTGIGILPLTILMVTMGEKMEHLPWFIWILILAGGLVLWLLFHLFARRFGVFRSRN